MLANEFHSPSNGREEKKKKKKKKKENPSLATRYLETQGAAARVNVFPVQLGDGADRVLHRCKLHKGLHAHQAGLLADLNLVQCSKPARSEARRAGGGGRSRRDEWECKRCQWVAASRRQTSRRSHGHNIPGEDLVEDVDRDRVLHVVDDDVHDLVFRALAPAAHAAHARAPGW